MLVAVDRTVYRTRTCIVIGKNYGRFPAEHVGIAQKLTSSLPGGNPEVQLRNS